MDFVLNSVCCLVRISQPAYRVAKDDPSEIHLSHSLCGSLNHHVEACIQIFVVKV